MGIIMCEIKKSFIWGISDQPTQSLAYAKLKKPKNQFRAPFWKPISAKMKNSSKITSIVTTSTLFVHKKLIYAYANYFHMIFLFHRILNIDNLLIMTSSVTIWLSKSIECIRKNILHKLPAYWTCHSRVVAYVLFLEHQRFFKF